LRCSSSAVRSSSWWVGRLSTRRERSSMLLACCCWPRVAVTPVCACHSLLVHGFSLNRKGPMHCAVWSVLYAVTQQA
jgi:hypothetical protein